MAATRPPVHLQRLPQRLRRHGLSTRLGRGVEGEGERGLGHQHCVVAPVARDDGFRPHERGLRETWGGVEGTGVHIREPTDE